MAKKVKDLEYFPIENLLVWVIAINMLIVNSVTQFNLTLTNPVTC